MGRLWLVFVRKSRLATKKVDYSEITNIMQVNLFKPKLDCNYERYRKQGKENRS